MTTGIDWSWRPDTCGELIAPYPFPAGLCSLEPDHEDDHVAFTGLPFNRFAAVRWGESGLARWHCPALGFANTLAWERLVES